MQNVTRATIYLFVGERFCETVLLDRGAECGRLLVRDRAPAHATSHHQRKVNG
jgi:hypothetical protein